MPITIAATEIIIINSLHLLNQDESDLLSSEWVTHLLGKNSF